MLIHMRPRLEDTHGSASHRRDVPVAGLPRDAIVGITCFPDPLPRRGKRRSRRTAAPGKAPVGVSQRRLEREAASLYSLNYPCRSERRIGPPIGFQGDARISSEPVPHRCYERGARSGGPPSQPASGVFALLDVLDGSPASF